jgi:LAO/AO transport system kinase
MAPSPPAPLDIERLAAGVRAGDRAQLARAITLVESARASDMERARELLDRVGSARGAVHRVGISGVPGVGKSTLVDALGVRLVERGHRVAVLAVDPSSTLSGGSILGDKSRMASLARSDAAFIRPSPNAASLGGVARRTRESMALVEAAGYDVVLVETVGVGQSEVAVAGMVDTFVVLLLPGAGDELQGIKKGILELADVLAVNKCDGENAARARAAVSDHSAALRYLRSRDEVWTPRVLAVSATTSEGLDGLWATIEEHRATLVQHGRLESRREEQRVRWVWSLVEEGLMDAFRGHQDVQRVLPELLESVRRGEEAATRVADKLLDAFLDDGAEPGQSPPG